MILLWHVDCSFSCSGLSEAARDPVKLWCPELGSRSLGCVFLKRVVCSSKLGQTHKRGPYVARLVHGHSPPERRGLSDSLDGLNCTKALSTRVPFKSSRTC